jgi:hypothetical protein
MTSTSKFAATGVGGSVGGPAGGSDRGGRRTDQNVSADQK